MPAEVSHRGRKSGHLYFGETGHLYFATTNRTRMKIDYVNLVVLAKGALYFLVSFILVFLTVYTVDCALVGKTD